MSDLRDGYEFDSSCSAIPKRGIISASLRQGWESIKRDPVMLIGLTLLITICWGWLGFVVPDFFSRGINLMTIGDTDIDTSYNFGPLKLCALLIIHVLRAGLLYTFLRVIRREAIPFNCVFSGFPKIIHIMIADIIVGIAIFCGFIFLILPAIFFAISFAFRSLLIIDRDADCISALHGSWQMMKGYRIDFLLLCLCIFALNILGTMALGIGLFLTLPLGYGAIAAFYERVLRENPPRVV